MSSGWWGLALLLALVAWWWFLDSRRELSGRLASWYVERARSMGRLAGPWAAATSTGAALACGAAALVSIRLAEASHSRPWGLAIILSVSIVYVPYALTTCPSRYGGYTQWRRALHLAGAEPRLQRAIAWWAGPPSVAGNVTAAVAVIACLMG